MTETLDPMDQTKIDHQKLAQQLLAQVIDAVVRRELERQFY